MARRAISGIYHLLTVAPEFDLEIFEEPSGSDFKRYTGNPDKN